MTPSPRGGPIAFDHEKRVAARLLDAIENGSLSVQDTRPLLDDADPVLVHLIFARLRANYHAGHSASEGVLGRIVGLCRTDPAVAAKARTGETDPISVWFEETYDHREIERDDFISLVVDKLEG